VHLFSKFRLLAILLALFCPFAMAQTDDVLPKVAAAMNADNKAVIVDVRGDDEWGTHHIHGAIHIPLAQLNARLSELEPYKNSAIITQCKGGVRSRKAQAVLKSAGFSKVYNLEGGIDAWDKEGLTTEQ
jgi:rhodanese-related sulfurtransferase